MVQKVKCFTCFLVVDASELKPSDDILKLHKEKRPECRFILRTEPGLNARSKKFLSYDSLRYEKERLETFIEWPIPWLSPEDLAADGFYYLRTNDHCACVFCRGIVGAWEVGDTPRGEHTRHFPHCPFIRGQPVGNVPLKHSEILDKLPLDGEECPLPPPRCENARDKSVPSTTGSNSGRHMPGSYPECKGPVRNNNINYDEIGLRQYSGPKRKDYVTFESRLKSYSKWPERVEQKPKEMAEAGFFYCGLSDHVRCFHCGNGLRNWENDDKPWDEHARWYPNCNFVLLSKGQEFIDKVRRENPPYLRSAAVKGSKPQKVTVSSGKFKPISESDLDPLMESDIIKAVKDMGFGLDKIRVALRSKLEQTGMPFLGLEPCIEAVLQVMEDETRQQLQGASSTTVEDEAVSRQSDKIQTLHEESQGVSSEATSSTAGTVNEPSQSFDVTSTPAVLSPPESPVVDQPSEVAVQPVTTSSEPLSAVVPTPSTSTSSVLVEQSVSSTVTGAPTGVESMEVDEEPSEPMESQDVVTSQRPVSQPENSPGTVIAMQEADERINAADEVLKPIRSGPSSIEAKSEKRDTSQETSERHASPVGKESLSTSQQSHKDIAEELERIRESRICKICMDAEMDVVFLPCTHMATCSKCAVTMEQCPICRDGIKYTIKPIFS
uniref:Inhibitor of apoptosis protein n=1 Tax=Palaemon carinicauda TaxID=392227 RepID=V9SG28_PALCI|nr:inhibitor of apoptosis protein [Palaemon carinicauda]